MHRVSLFASRGIISSAHSSVVPDANIDSAAFALFLSLLHRKYEMVQNSTHRGVILFYTTRRQSRGTAQKKIMQIWEDNYRRVYIPLSPLFQLLN
ncbi:hypothetical protein GWI33_002438 [Rhynchophorus ferrugineus]|uniref:Uncharacterized protein n=1 Tax=Rhynchophorus ferrugineus TaxID=354439 RepID=A0A834MLI5_RHYFE|nr:hypothetical protein GWI33_002438 [Rhynchophorus ferrugineus]